MFPNASIPYLHFLLYHTEDIIKRHGSIAKFSQEGDTHLSPYRVTPVGFEAANNQHRTIVVRSTNMGGGKNPKHVQQQVMEKIYRIIYLNTRSKIGHVAMTKYFPLAEKHLHDWKFYEYALRGDSQ